MFIMRSLKLWWKNLFSLLTLKAFLAALGVIWALAEPTAFFSNQFSQFIKDKYLWLLAGAVLYVLWDRRPKLKFSERLNGRDVCISLVIGDVFECEGALIIGANTTFDTNDLISEHSIQGQFTKRYYANRINLDREIGLELGTMTFKTLGGQRAGKDRQYEVGTVVKLMPKGKTAYLLAMAHINEHGTAYGSFEDLKRALASLWVYLGERGGKETIIIPVLGTGFGRINQPREQVIKEIIKSFVAACSDKLFCEDLNIVISYKDITKHSIDIDKLHRFLSYTCEHTELLPSPLQPYQEDIGTALDSSGTQLP